VEIGSAVNEQSSLARHRQIKDDAKFLRHQLAGEAAGVFDDHRSDAIAFNATQQR
jgi:hypothetical protein